VARSPSVTHDLREELLHHDCRALGGTKNGQDLINIFSPDCQKQVKVADVNAGSPS